MKMGRQLRNIGTVVQQLNKIYADNENVGPSLDELAKIIEGFNKSSLIDILFGCIEYKPLLDVVVNAFYNRDGIHCCLSDHNLYVVVCYLATFQLEELGLQKFIRIVKPLNAAKICKVPESSYKSPRLEQCLKEMKLKNRQKAEDLLLEANINPFSCAVPKPQYKSTIINQEPKHAQRFQAQKIRGKTDNASLKLNATAILREGVLYQRKMEEELSRVEKLLRGARDPSEFLDWQKQMRENDLCQQLAEAECRRLQGKLSYEEAILAHQNCTQKNQEIAEQKRLEKAEMWQQLKEMHLQEESEKKKLVQQVAEGHRNVKQAQMKLQKHKHQIVQAVSEETREFLLQALEQQEEEFKKRCELTQKIRAIEYLPFHKNRFLDLTQTGDHGVLGEMSIVELQERLALLNEAQKKAEDEKRDLIIQEKRNKQQRLLETVEQISMFREAFGRTAALKQEQKKTKPQFHEGLLKDERVLELQKKIVEKSLVHKIQSQNLKTAPAKSQEKSKKLPKDFLHPSNPAFFGDGVANCGQGNSWRFEAAA